MSHDRVATISEVFDRVLGVDPGRVGLVGPSGVLRYEELDGLANAAAAALGGLGVGRGDRVAVSLPNDIDIVVAFHGVMRLGAIWVGVNRSLAPAEKEALLSAASPVVVLADRETAAVHGADWLVLSVDPADAGSPWASAVAASVGAPRPALPDPEAPAAIAFTSGTTGAPKGVVHSQRNLLLPAAALVASRGYDETLRKGDCLPLTILNMQVLTTLVTSAAGGCCVVTDRRDARGVAEWIGRESVTVWNGVPALLYSMVHDVDLDPVLLASLGEVWNGGASCPEEVLAGFRARFGRPVYQAYGLTEAPTVVTIDPIDGGHVEGSSGVALPHLAVRVCDDDGVEVPVGQEGEIVVGAVDEGPWAGVYRPLLGYWRDGKVEPFDDRELRTGDIGVLDEAGNLFVRDRKSLVILRGGANVYPTEVEAVLERAVGVRASAVLGVADRRLGQRVVAAVEVDPDTFDGPEALTDHCRTYLARYKIPEQIVVVDTLPRNAMGKVQRTALTGLFATTDR